ncbi:TPA: hypothetical protein DEB00_03855 [Candidatus Uhrbacteria bacterium]|nr:hypothetical protein [Candidatus Uhrbacteria bacterium]
MWGKQIIVPGVLCGFMLTILSVFLITQFEGQVGNVCERTTENPYGICYQMLPQGGWPYPYLIDSNGSSVIGQLGPEDQWDKKAFFINWLIYSAIMISAAATRNYYKKYYDKLQNTR